MKNLIKKILKENDWDWADESPYNTTRKDDGDNHILPTIRRGWFSVHELITMYGEDLFDSRVIKTHEEMIEYGVKGARWEPARNNEGGKRSFEMYDRQYGPFIVYTSKHDKNNVMVCIGDWCYTMNDNNISKNEVASMLNLEIEE